MTERDRKQIVAEVWVRSSTLLPLWTNLIRNILKDLHHENIVSYYDRVCLPLLQVLTTDTYCFLVCWSRAGRVVHLNGGSFSSMSRLLSLIMFIVLWWRWPRFRDQGLPQEWETNPRRKYLELYGSNSLGLTILPLARKQTISFKWACYQSIYR